MVGLLLGRTYMQAVGADAATVQAGTAYLLAYVPAGVAVRLVAWRCAPRHRHRRPTMLVQMATVVLNTCPRADRG
jgi:hypothetical protein